MIIKDFKYSPFTLKLKIPFLTSKQLINKREGFIISATDEIDNTGYSECSPLPGFSKETKIQAEINLDRLKTKLLNTEISEELSALSFQLSAYKLTSSVQFAVEQAIISLLIQRDKNFIGQYFRNTKHEINVNAVIGFNRTENILAKIEEKIKNGYDTVKIKVGRDNFEEDFELVKIIREKSGNKIYLRLDANGKWNLEEAINNLQRLSIFNIQYIEEPCKEITCLLKLADKSPVSIAVDESINSIDIANKVIHNSSIKFIIIKPMIVGGIISSFQLIKETETKNKIIIISSSLESVIGKSALVFLAALTNHNFSHGLDTSEYFERDLSDDPYNVKNGKIQFDYKAYPQQLNLNTV